MKVAHSLLILSGELESQSGDGNHALHIRQIRLMIIQQCRLIEFCLRFNINFQCDVKIMASPDIPTSSPVFNGIVLL